MLSWLVNIIFGKPINPLNPKSRESITLIALLAWVGLGADAKPLAFRPLARSGR